MKELLKRWAAMEPERCENLYNQAFRFHLEEGEYTHSIYPVDDYLSKPDLAWIQWATQQAIVSRGWGFELTLNTDWENRAESMVRYGVNWTSSPAIQSDPAEALLSAYLKALEESR